MNMLEIHMVAGDGYYLACGASPQGTIISMTEEFEKVTCTECQIKWLTYERDQYKEMWERAKDGEVAGRPSQRQIIEMREQLNRQATTIGRMHQELEKLRSKSADTQQPSSTWVMHRHNPYTTVGTLCGSYEIDDQAIPSGRKEHITCNKCLALMS